MRKERYYNVQGIDTDGRYQNYVLPTRARARDTKAVLKAFGGRQVAIYRMDSRGRVKVY